MSKYTPGPWERFRAERKVRPNVWTISAEPTEHEKSLCTEEGDQPEGEIIVDGEMSEANARLIAAAPELLGWLKAVVRQMEYERPKAEKIYTNGFTGLFGMQENLEAIIAKAEGKKK